MFYLRTYCYSLICWYPILFRQLRFRHPPYTFSLNFSPFTEKRAVFAHLRSSIYKNNSQKIMYIFFKSFNFKMAKTESLLYFKSSSFIYLYIFVPDESDTPFKIPLKLEGKVFIKIILFLLCEY